MRDFFALATLVVTGIIVADVLTHQAGTKAAGGVLTQLTSTSFGALLGAVPAGA